MFKITMLLAYHQKNIHKADEYISTKNIVYGHMSAYKQLHSSKNLKGVVFLFIMIKSQSWSYHKSCH